MKKILAIIICLFISLSLLTSCDVIMGIVGLPDKDGTHEETPEETPEEKPEEKPEELPEEKPEEKPEENKYLYNAFTPNEKNLFETYIGTVIPFAPSDEYYLEGYYDESDYENGINYYTIGNTREDYDAYRALYANYELYETYEDEYGDTWYCYVMDDVVVDMCYYLFEGEYYIDVYVYSELSEDDPDLGGGEDADFIYTAFTSEERALLMSIVGEVIPFAPNNEYYVESGYDEYYEENYVGFYTFGNSQTDFNAYLKLYSQYSLVDSFEDEDGDTWYCYEKGNTYVELAFYYYEGDYVIDVYAYGVPAESGGNEGGESGETNLPEGQNGIFNVDFTDAKNVKDVTDQGYYIDGCPTVGAPGVLVIPVEFSDLRASSKNLSIDSIEQALLGDADYYSLYEYYLLSSDGKLELDITVLDEWFCPKYTSSYYEMATMDYYGDSVACGDMLVLDEALDYLEELMDLSAFDSDGNQIIDSVILITTLDVGDDDFHWAYRYWNIYTDDEGYCFEYDGVSANDYLWMSCDFIHESYDENDEVIYTDRSVINTYTVIHEFGHILGLDDYYDTSDAYNDPLEGCDMMDAMTGDHNPFSKFNLGWITESRLVTDVTTLTLLPFGESGDTVIIANSFDPALGAYQEYYIICYYTMEGLNSGDYGYFDRDGIVVYHVNATLVGEDYDGETYYDIKNNNTSPTDEYGTVDNLIEFVKSGEGNFTYIAGDSMTGVTDDLGRTLIFGFTVDEITEDGATITITKS